MTRLMGTKKRSRIRPKMQSASAGLGYRITLPNYKVSNSMHSQKSAIAGGARLLRSRTIRPVRTARPAIHMTVTRTPPRSRTPTTTNPLSRTTTAIARRGTSWRTPQGRRIRSNSTTTTTRRAGCPRTRSATSEPRPRRAIPTSSRTTGWGGSSGRRWWIRSRSPGSSSITRTTGRGTGRRLRFRATFTVHAVSGILITRGVT